MSQPISPTHRDTWAAAPRPRRTSRTPSARQLREQDWRTLIGTYRLLSRLTVERSRHHRIDEADTLARQAAAVEEELEHAYPFRWPRCRPALLLEQAAWWREPHNDDPLHCRTCQMQAGMPGERIDLPVQRRTEP
jgi:hypothetical protein